MYMVHGNLAALAFCDVEVFPDLVESDIRATPAGTVHGRYLLRLRIVVQAEHITADAR